MSSLKKNNLYVLGAMSICQYMMTEKTSTGENKILTIIGESHEQDYEEFKKECPTPNITVFDYIKRISTDSDSNLMLEIPPQGIGTRNYKSKNLNSLIEYSIEKQIPVPITGIDIRPTFINSPDLYSNNDKLLSSRVIDVLSQFYMTMPGAIGRLRSMISYELLTREQFNYLHTFLDQLNEDFKLIKSNFLETADKLIHESEEVTMKEYIKIQKTIKGVTAKGKSTSYTMIDIFRVFWMKVTDFIIINNLYMSDYKHNIILVGYAHANNLDDIFFMYRTYPSRYKPIESPVKNCTYVSNLSV